MGDLGHLGKLAYDGSHGRHDDQLHQKKRDRHYNKLVAGQQFEESLTVVVAGDIDHQ